MTQKSGFSPANSPHLTPALELDSAMIEFSASLSSKGLPTLVNSEQDVDTLMNAFTGTVKGLDFWQYYVLDVEREKDSVKAALVSGKTITWTGANVEGKSVVELANLIRSSSALVGLGQYASRFGVRSEAGVAAGLVKAAFVELQDPSALADAWGRVVDVINVPLYEEWEQDTKVAIDNVRNRLKYTRLDENGPKLGAISKRYISVHQSNDYVLIPNLALP
jgi:glycogen debranching enzyme